VTEWSVNNPANVPLVDVRGGFAARQTCRDGDPLCDFDGGVDDRCTFRVRTCANNTDVPDCTPSTRLASWQLKTPSASKAARDPVAAAVRTALLSTVPSVIVGPDDRDVCSADAEIVVPIRNRIGKVTIKTRATLYDGTKDNDKMTFVCVP
jgi:hypothetical protein